MKGVGNVCSFAQMDVRKHGNPEWQLPVNKAKPQVEEEAKHYAVENGKTELSLVHFTLTNPEWRMPPDARQFMKGIRRNAIQDLMRAKTSEPDNNTAMAESLVSFGTIGEEVWFFLNCALFVTNLMVFLLVLVGSKFDI